MYFGKTDLPMFKVYGADIKGTAWEYLKSGKEFREDKLKEMADLKSCYCDWPNLKSFRKKNKDNGRTAQNIS